MKDAYKRVLKKICFLLWLTPKAKTKPNIESDDSFPSIYNSLNDNYQVSE